MKLFAVLLLALTLIGIVTKCEYVGEILGVPNLRHPLGTDPLGRDALQCLLRGTTITILVAFSAATLTILFSLVLLLLSMTSQIATRVIESLIYYIHSLPRLPLFIVIATMLFVNVYELPLILSTLLLPSAYITLAARLNAILEKEFVKYSESAGASRWFIFKKHVLPHISPLFPILFSYVTERSVILFAAVGLLGLSNPTLPTWGSSLYLILETPGAIFTISGVLQITVTLFIFILTTYKLGKIGESDVQD